MTPKEKAKELIEKFEKNVTVEVMQGFSGAHQILTKQCALIAAEECRIEGWRTGKIGNERELYWWNVIEEINKL